MKAYKGFNKDLQCAPGGKVFQYAIGETYEKPVAKLCEHGFHACESPLNVWDYYPPVDGNRFCEVELDGVSNERGDDTKVTAKKITVGAELGIPGIVKAHVEWVKEQLKKGDDTAENASGNNSVIMCAGNGGIVKANVGSWFTLSEWNIVDGAYKPVFVKTAYVDGKTIKADTWYALKGGAFVEVDECEE